MTDYSALLRRNPDFRRAFVAELLSLGADGFAIVPLLTMLPALTGGGLMGSLALGADMAIVALLAPYAGTVADRFDRRRILVLSNLCSAAAVLLLLLVRTPSTAWISLAAVGAIAVSKAFYLPASAAALPNLVEPADLPAATALSSAAWALMLIAGTSFGGVLAQQIGVAGCFLLDAGFLLAAAALTSSVRRSYQDSRPGVDHWGAGHALGEALRYVRTDAFVRAVLTSKPVITLGNGALTLFPLLAASVFGVGPAGAGLFYAARGLGYLLGPLALRGMLLRPGRLLPGLAALMGVFGVSYVLVGLAPNFATALVLVTIAHSAGAAAWVFSNYAVQSTVPDRLRGRVVSADFTLAMLALMTTQVVTGVLSDHLPLRLLASAGGAVTLVGAVAWTLLTSQARRAAVTGSGSGSMRN